MRAVVLCLAVSLLAGGCGLAVGPAAESLVEVINLVQLAEELQKAGAIARDPSLSKAQWHDADRRLEAGIANPAFADLEPRAQALAWAARGWAQIHLGDERAALPKLRQSVESDPTYSWGWLALSGVQTDLEAYPEAAQALATAIELRPEHADGNDRQIFQLIHETQPGTVGTRRLVEALESIDWHSTSPREGDVWRRLALDRIRQDDRKGARDALLRIHTPDAVVRVRIDRRFDGLYGREEAEFDPATASASRIVSLRAEVAAHPRSLERRSNLADELLGAGKNQEALDVLDFAARAVKSDPEASPFDDMDRMAWIGDQRSSALFRLGRKEESLKTLERAATVKVGKQANVDQALNLAGRHCANGRGDELQQALAQVGTDLSPYGRTVYHYMRHCGAVLTGDASVEAKELDYLRAHRDAGGLTYLRALLRSERFDDAAAEMIARLRSERSREEMLFELQDFPRGDRTSRSTSARRWDRLVARSDVREVLAEVGRIERFEGYGY